MSLTFTTAQTDEDLRQILSLQAQNLKTNLSEEAKQQQGFVTVQHTWEQLSLMHRLTPQIVAKDNGLVVGYALSMMPEMGELIPDLQPMFALLEQIPWQGTPLSRHRYYVMGQVCVGASHRGMGVFDGLYQQHREVYSPNFDVLVTEISKSNTRSQRAHERVGFRTIFEHEDHVDTWNVVAWGY
ncbi:GNAT family N-acetyltransferase [Arundinibacter roseus]|uniref:GNAT family N-acetyltransferase n=1 Tax=Arundinibacter roseus TaxID=2070510 RepID=A0A4R4KAL7_9BACT|nr:GNAT family N-acetyltransferase [Arundinibacter roseus]TDB63431.1 GNAT family N-acetyltransferase [Arundinibacter roseus]